MAAERYNELIYTALRENIVAKRIPAGLVLSETDVARFFGVGRTPVRWALQRLSEESFVKAGSTRGYVVHFGGETVRPVRRSIAETEAVLPDYVAERLRFRNQRERLYPEMEREVASALSFGEFTLTEQDVAAFYGVSRTIARELLGRLNRVGLVEQQRNGRWCAGPLTPEKIRNHYEMRFILEPHAIRQAAETYPRGKLDAKRQRLQDSLSRVGDLTAEEIFEIESELHFDIVLSCPNPEMRRTIYCNQLPVINVHYTFQGTPNESGVRHILNQHGQVLDHLMERDGESAAQVLREHLEFGLTTTLERYEVFSRNPIHPVPPYMKLR